VFIECIENASYFEEEIILNRSNIDDIFFHKESAVEGFEEDIEIGTK
jgi:hypothetical protein